MSRARVTEKSDEWERGLTDGRARRKMKTRGMDGATLPKTRNA